MPPMAFFCISPITTFRLQATQNSFERPEVSRRRRDQ
jgi:hypothetical protein